MGEHEGKVTLVTGAASGIGRAAARLFAEAGSRVMCADIDLAGARETADEIGARAAAIELDVSDGPAVQKALQETLDVLGGFDVLFNNAGLGGGHGYERTLDVNLNGVYYGLFYGAELMAERGGGAIVNTASVLGLVGMHSPVPRERPIDPSGVAYVASKHGVVGLTRQFALYYAPYGVRVNAVNPGYIATPMSDPVRDQGQLQRSFEELHPMGRLGEPEEVAEAAVFLASERASFITGVTLPVDGGYTAR